MTTGFQQQQTDLGPIPHSVRRPQTVGMKLETRSRQLPALRLEPRLPMVIPKN